MKFTTVSLLLAVASASPVDNTEASLKAQALENAKMTTDSLEQTENNLVDNSVNLVDNLASEATGQQSTSLGDMLGDVVANNPNVLSRLLVGVLGSGGERQYEKREESANDQLGSVLGDLLNNELANALFEAALNGNGQRMQRREESAEQQGNGGDNLVGGLIRALLGGQLVNTDRRVQGLVNTDEINGLRAHVNTDQLVNTNGINDVFHKTTKNLPVSPPKVPSVQAGADVAMGPRPLPVSDEMPQAAQQPEEQQQQREEETPAAEQAESVESAEPAEEGEPPMEKRDLLDLNNILQGSLRNGYSANQDSALSLTPLVDSLLAQDGAVNRITDGTYNTLNQVSDLEKRDGASRNLGGLLGLNNINLASLLGTNRANRQGSQYQQYQQMHRANQAPQSPQSPQAPQAPQSDSSNQFEQAVLFNALRQLQQATQDKQQGQGREMVEGPPPKRG
ncbi:hypothetical protein CP532_0966 [Ophiocordyceps camponoti-leonardi (nom. inval.)]|nr:hypothetical protein CP532_0966 [Ophiocordyceps camponoti-leonardi (nom. inval.)]